MSEDDIRDQIRACRERLQAFDDDSKAGPVRKSLARDPFIIKASTNFSPEISPDQISFVEIGDFQLGKLRDVISQLWPGVIL